MAVASSGSEVRGGDAIVHLHVQELGATYPASTPLSKHVPSRPTNTTYVECRTTVLETIK
jgi:hypothetical protein